MQVVILLVVNANINITSKGDGIKSTNDTDAELGYIAIEGGKININAGDDGIHSETKIVINISNSNIEKGKTYTLYVNGSSVGSLTVNSIVTSNLSSNGNGGMQGGKGMQPDGMQPNRGGKP